LGEEIGNISGLNSDEHIPESMGEAEAVIFILECTVCNRPYDAVQQ
jgi:hypothetical protein